MVTVEYPLLEDEADAFAVCDAFDVHAPDTTNIAAQNARMSHRLRIVLRATYA